MNFFDAIQSKSQIKPDTQVIFVADLFVETYVGGAELTTEALVASSPYRVQKVFSRDVSKEMIDQHKDKAWIFGNIAMLNPAVVPAIMGNCKYVVLEYDYKFCAHRSLEKHLAVEGKPCDCHEKPIGDLISTFFGNSSGIFWMSEQQQEIYRNKFPSLEDTDQYVLSSVFDETFFMSLKILREKYKDHDRTEWLVLRSNSWIKGSEAGVEYCKKNSLPYREISGLSYDALLEELAQAKGFVFLPPGGDTCPRIVIEAKLLGCELVLNDNVQHAKEMWFETSDLAEIEQYLYASRELFWNFVKNEIVEKIPRLSGYTTTYNCVSQKYPFEQCVQSMLDFCDEVVVVDGGSTDGTLAVLIGLQRQNLIESTDEYIYDKDLNEKSRLKVQVIARDWSHPRFAVFDGMQKAEARALCTGDFCLQLDADEIISTDDGPKFRNLICNFPKGVDLVSLPVIEGWGTFDKTRIDITPWKWRLSRNVRGITHGVPITHRKFDENGQLYAIQGTDGCDMISSRTGESIPFVGFYDKKAHELRQLALSGNEQARVAYENWFNDVIDQLPSVFHFSWMNIERKIRTYRDYWQSHWLSLYNQQVDDIPENNMFFDKSWKDVTNDDIEKLSHQLAAKTGGHIFHSKWKGHSTPSIACRKKVPSL